MILVHYVAYSLLSCTLMTTPLTGLGPEYQEITNRTEFEDDLDSTSRESFNHNV